jgi:2-keto-4-pentenoate hydratase/2-oxohepta-3-ene-1,7-dioic acid hydratase in catechol pathway
VKLISFLLSSTRKVAGPSLTSWELATKANWGVLIESHDEKWVKPCGNRNLPTLLSLIEAGPKTWEELRVSAKRWARKPPRERKLLSKIKLLSPLPRPPSMRDFLAFEEHSSWSWKKRGLELPPEWYEMPVYYKGNHRTLFGHGDTIPWPRFTQKLDYELELAMIVGRAGKNISPKDAHRHIFGFTVMNDWSARDIQAKEMICRLGPAKGKDFATSLGPCIVTTDELNEASGLSMTAKVNGETWSSGNSGTRRWSFEQMIAHVSQDEAIYPGDVYGSGTVGKGCGLELDRWLRPNDHVSLEIEGIGTLENRIENTGKTKI